MQCYDADRKECRESATEKESAAELGGRHKEEEGYEVSRSMKSRGGAVLMSAWLSLVGQGVALSWWSLAGVLAQPTGTTISGLAGVK